MLDDFPSLRDQRDAFRAAGRRDAARAARRRRTRVAAGTLAALGVAGGVATATQLIAVGEPERDPVPRPADLRPAAPPAVDVVVPDSPLPWAAAAFESADGRSCAIAGQLRAGRLGIVRDGRFRPFEPGTGGPCADLRRAPLVFSPRSFADRTIVYGRAARRARTVTVTGPDGSRVARTGQAGVFLLVYDGALRIDELRAVVPRDARGRVVR